VRVHELTPALQAASPSVLPELVEGPSFLPEDQQEKDSPSTSSGRTGSGRLEQVTLSAQVSKGTYIRSLARDIARTLGTVGHVTTLRRVKAGPFTLDKAISLDKLSQFAKARRLEEVCLPLTAGLDDIPALTVTAREADLLRKGQQPTGSAARPGLHLALLDDVPVALVECSGGILRVVRGFNL
jgi:tRNA pseudouridine55 synthase